MRNRTKMRVSRTSRNRKNQKSLKRRMNRTAILRFYSHRTLRGDGVRLAEETGYSESHISNVRAGRRRINSRIANAMYYLSRRRNKQEDLA